MSDYRIEQDDDGTRFTRVSLRGRALLSDPMYNKGSAFTEAEREHFALRGLLPPMVSQPDQQLERAYRNIQRKTDPLERYIGLAALQDRNETLFYRLVHRYLEEMAPIVYTPTVGQACQRYSHIFRRGRGVWITPADRGSIAKLLAQVAPSNVQLIVATDNERILGLGDQGAGGMGIPVGKLVLYTVGAGIHPSRVLPISLDVGTDNEQLLNDPLYIGWPHKRLRGAPYDELVEEFVQAIKQCFPNALLQWEDFKKTIALTLLDRYRTELLSFNDDIQGTAAVTVAGVIASTRVSRLPLARQRIVMLGAGAAGIGISRLLRTELTRNGLTGEALTSAITVLDSRGPLIAGRDFRDRYKEEFAWPRELAEKHGLHGDGMTLTEVVKALKPTVLIGTSGRPGMFTEPMVRAMAEHCERPVIFPLSNPTSQAEATPSDLLNWTDGRALVATGSPFDPVELNGRVHRIGQGNNVFVFPGVGLGALAAGASQVSDSMFAVAARQLASSVTEQRLAEGALFPSLSQLRPITAAIAVKVALEASAMGVAPKLDEAAAEQRVKAMMWQPEYVELRPV